MNLTGKRALVTGGTKGMGAAIAAELAAGRSRSRGGRPAR